MFELLKASIEMHNARQEDKARKKAREGYWEIDYVGVFVHVVIFMVLGLMQFRYIPIWRYL